MSKIGIVTIGYNRKKSLQRLIDSILRANINQSVDLIMSIDKSDTNEVVEYANSVDWKYGKKMVKAYDENLGLRQHVLNCGNYLNDYDYEAIVVLEDDIIVAPDFLNYANQAIEKYKNDDNIAGISLYTHTWNINAKRPFIPLKKEEDAYFLQYAQSWGQIWLKKQWNDFYNWYINKKYEEINKTNVPKNVLDWNEKSWLKYHIEYCIDKNKYFVYPYFSLTTNFSDAGTHVEKNSTRMQVPMDISINKKYFFPDFNEDAIKYDAFFEYENLDKSLKIFNKDLIVDLYGIKEIDTKKGYLLSTKQINYKIVKSFGLQLKPQELNIYSNISGNDIFLYDLTKEEINKFEKNLNLHIINYDTRGELMTGDSICKLLKEKITNKLFK